MNMTNAYNRMTKAVGINMKATALETGFRRNSANPTDAMRVAALNHCKNVLSLAKYVYASIASV